MNYLKNANAKLAARAKPHEKIELPPIVRDFYENVRGCTEMLGNITAAYINKLEQESTAWAKKHDKDLPVHPEEIAAYRKLFGAGLGE